MFYLVYSIKFADFNKQAANTTQNGNSYKDAGYLKCRKPKCSRQ